MNGSYQRFASVNGVDKKGLTKTGVNGLIDALKNIREKMVR
jgi:hypothetical protein